MAGLVDLGVRRALGGALTQTGGLVRVRRLAHEVVLDHPLPPQGCWTGPSSMMDHGAHRALGGASSQAGGLVRAWCLAHEVVLDHPLSPWAVVPAGAASLLHGNDGYYGLS